MLYGLFSFFYYKFLSCQPKPSNVLKINLISRFFLFFFFKDEKNCVALLSSLGIVFASWFVFARNYVNFCSFFKNEKIVFLRMCCRCFFFKCTCPAFRAGNLPTVPAVLPEVLPEVQMDACEEEALVEGWTASISFPVEIVLYGSILF